MLRTKSLVPQAPVERLDKPVLHSLAWTNENQHGRSAIRPGIHRATLEVGLVVDRDESGSPRDWTTVSNTAVTASPRQVGAATNATYSRLN